MPWQIEEVAGKPFVAVSEGGMPLWVPEVPEGETPGDPVEVDWPKALETITRLNSESKTRRESLETMEASFTETKKKLESFKDLDPKKAKEAMKKLESIDQGELLTADKVESFKSSILQAANDEKAKVVGEKEEVINDVTGKLEKALAKIDDLVISNAFSNSEFVKKLGVPVDMIKMYFSKNFTIEDDHLVGYMNGNKINSRKTPGETAPFDEAMGIIVDQYPEKDKLFPGTRRGSGAEGGGDRGSKLTGADIKDLSMPEYEKLKKEGRI